MNVKRSQRKRLLLEVAVEVSKNEEDEEEGNSEDQRS